MLEKAYQNHFLFFFFLFLLDLGAASFSSYCLASSLINPSIILSYANFAATSSAAFDNGDWRVAKFVSPPFTFACVLNG
jgi:hypothetical protein